MRSRSSLASYTIHQLDVLSFIRRRRLTGRHSKTVFAQRCGYAHNASVKLPKKLSASCLTQNAVVWIVSSSSTEERCVDEITYEPLTANLAGRARS